MKLYYDSPTISATRAITNNGGNGIEFSGQSFNAEIRANRIVKNGGFGVAVDEGATGNTIVDNILEENDEGPCDVSNDDNVVNFNVPECDISE